ncbi:Uncharacterised protein [Mycobacterium tuberculosis]|nr:Uncharacterised protein [Mycobacterium tuberculosis]
MVPDTLTVARPSMASRPWIVGFCTCPTTAPSPRSLSRMMPGS